MKRINLILFVLSIIRNRYAHSPRVVYTYVMNIIHYVYYMRYIFRVVKCIERLPVFQ